MSSEISALAIEKGWSKSCYFRDLNSRAFVYRGLLLDTGGVTVTAGGLSVDGGGGSVRGGANVWGGLVVKDSGCVITSF